MKQYQIDIMGLVTTVPLAIFITNELLIMCPSISFWECTLLTIIIGVFFLFAVLIFILNLGNMGKSVYSMLHGFSPFPIFLYPLYFYKCKKSDKIKLYLVFDWTAMFRDMFSYDFMVSLKEKEMIHEDSVFCARALKVKCYMRIGVSCITSVLFFAFRNMELSLFFSLLAVLFLFIARLETKYYHGELTKCKNIQKGLLFIYLAKEMCVYSVGLNSAYTAFARWICTVDNDDSIVYFSNFISSILKHMFIEDCALGCGIVDKNVLSFANANIVEHSHINMGMFDESWELMKTLIMYCIIKGNDEELRFLTQELQYMRFELSRILPKFNPFFNWYIKVAQKNDSIKDEKRYPLVASRDRFCVISPKYKVYIESMEDAVLA